MKSKECVACKNKKPITEFSTHKETADNLRTRCKNCRSIRQQIRYASKNPSKRVKPANPNNKYCYVCNTEKVRADFHKSSSSSDGLCIPDAKAAIIRFQESIEKRLEDGVSIKFIVENIGS